MPKEDVGGIGFHNCTFNISAGEGKWIFNIESIVSDIIAEMKKKICDNDKLLRKVSSQVGILRNNFSQKSQTIEHIDFGLGADSTLANIFHTQNITQASKEGINHYESIQEEKILKNIHI